MKVCSQSTSDGETAYIDKFEIAVLLKRQHLMSRENL